MSLLRVFQRPLVCLRTRAYTTNVAPVADAADKPKKAPAAQTQAPRSSCAPDTIITGANYLKAQPPVLALADDQYPEWLWSILKPKVWPDDGPGGKGERVQRRVENKQRIKDRNFMSTQ